jgi:hypothetical protein
VPDRRTHRGPHPEDARLFAGKVHANLSQAVDDLCWLLSKRYSPESSLKLVGDRYGLVARQRIAVARCSCSKCDGRRRRAHELTGQSLINRSLKLDGYNVLTTVEAALSGGVILAARDGTFRDMASMHGTYRKVTETLPALELLGNELAELNLAECFWYLDRPVSNSGRLKMLMEELAGKKGWPWQVELAQNPDVLLAESPDVVATADSVVLNRCRWWYNLARIVITRHVRRAWIVDLSEEEKGDSPDFR